MPRPTDFDVTGPIDRIVTQMYFDCELLNEKDEFLQQVGCKECLTAKLAPPSKDVEPDSLNGGLGYRAGSRMMRPIPG